jgi:hypothetical protein
MQRTLAVSLRRRPPGRDGSDCRIVGGSVDTMIVSTKLMMGTIADVDPEIRRASGGAR